MSPSGEPLYQTGDYGTRVAVVARANGRLVLRYAGTTKTLKHADLALAKRQARALSQALASERALTSGAPAATHGLTLAQLLARYAKAVSVHKKGSGPSEDARRRTLWLAFLGPDTRVIDLKPRHIEAFVTARRQGKVLVEGIDLKRNPSPRTVQADVDFLLIVMRWAERNELVAMNPLRAVRSPRVEGQLRPMASPARAALVLAHAHQAHERFPLFLTCVRSLGWRVSAICALRGDEVDRSPALHAPHGRVRKNEAVDKEGVGGWLPMPRAMREALDAAGVIGRGYLFQAVKNRRRPWSRSYARDLLERAEKAAGLTAIEGGDFHPYRRLWATERKHLPVVDIARAGQWKDTRSAEKYILADPATTADVMLFEPSSADTSGSTSGSAKPTKRTRGGRRSA